MKKYNYDPILEVWKEPRIDYVEIVRVNKRKRRLKLMWISIGLIFTIGAIFTLFRYIL